MSNLINKNTGMSQKLNASRNSYLLKKELMLKEYASKKCVKYSNKLMMRKYSASSPTKAFWIMITSPFLKFFHKVGMVIAQGFINCFIIPFYHLKIKINATR